MNVVGHRNRLRSFEAIGGLVYLELTAELVVQRPLGRHAPLAFIVTPTGIRLADPTCVPAGMTREATGGSAPASDLTQALHRATASLRLREVHAGVDTWVPLETVIADTHDIGPYRHRHFAVRFVATACFDLRSTVRPAARSGRWDVSTVLDVLGTRTVASVGRYRARSQVDVSLAPSEIDGGGRVVPQLVGRGPRLELQLIDAARSR